MPRMHRTRRLVGFALPAMLAVGAAAQDETITIFNAAPLQWSAEAPESAPHEGYVALSKGQVVEAKVALPAAPENQRDARRIVAIIDIQPIVTTEEGQPRIADPWTRLGSVCVVVPGGDPLSPATVELFRFITPFGGGLSFEHDVTAYAPILSGDTTMRSHLSTWFTPAWTVSLRLEYRVEGAGYRRPRLVLPVFSETRLTSAEPRRTVSIHIPDTGLALPRLHIITSGHGGSQEFLAADHILRVDNKEITRWRPWREDGGSLHPQNPTSRRIPIDGRELWSSDIDRAGWIPGTVVEPTKVPLPELTPGDHVVELEIVGIVPPQEGATGGYWLVSVTVVADEPWPAVGDERP